MMVRSVRFWLSSVAALASVALMLLATPSALADISHGYPVSSDITPGSIVALSADGSGKVMPATQALIDRTIGVVVTGSTLSLGANSGEVQVATDGVATTLVSTAAGDIKKGDYITISPLTGVGEKAIASGRIVGVAQDDFSTGTAGAQTVTVKEANKEVSVAVGQIPVQVGVTTYNLKSSSVTVTGIVQNFAQTIAGKPVGTARIYVALVIILAALVSSVSLLYAAVRTSIVAVGRNPLAKSSVMSSLTKIIGVAILILAVAAFAVYLVVR